MTKMGQEVRAQDFIEDVSVRRRLDNKTIMTIEDPEIGGFSLSFDSKFKNIANYDHKGVVPEEYTEQILDVYLTTKFTNRQDFLFTSVEFVTSAKRSFEGGDGEDYYITCNHPTSMERNQPFKIEALVKRGETPIDHANVVAKISVSRESDPNNQFPPLFIELKDDGDETVSGDAKANDGIYTTQLTPESLQIDANDALGMSIMCNMVESDDAIWNDNNFLGKKKSLPTQNGDFTPYCCGTKEQKWNIPKSEDVVKLIRSSVESGAFLDPSLFVKDSDFGPPARIADLKAEKFGDDTDGLVKLSWTATGDDWGTGTAQSYNLVYSDKRKGLMSSNKIVKDSRMLVGGSMDPVPAGQKMEVIVKLENHHIPGTYLFALNASDDAGKVSMPSNVARVNFHDGSPLVFDVDPHVVHGHKKNEMPFEDKIRAIVKDERVVTGFMALIEKNKKIVWDAENNVMEKRLKEKMGTNSHLVEKIMEKIKKDEVLRAVYKSKLL